MVERSADQRIRTTEWEDVQYKHGNKVGKYRTHEMEILAQRIADANPNAQLKAYDPNEECVRDRIERCGYDVDPDRQGELLGLKEGSNASAEERQEFDDEDDALAAFRQKRLAELRAKARSHIYGVVKQIPGEDYIKEITEASSKCWVVACMVKLGHDDSDNLLTIMRQSASRNRDIKFVSLIAKEAIANFPDKHLPCVLLYHDGQLVRQYTGLSAWCENPLRERSPLTLASFEKELAKNNVIKGDDYDEDIEDEYNKDIREKMSYRAGDLLRKH